MIHSRRKYLTDTIL